MNEQTINEQYGRIISLLNQRRITDVLADFHSFVANISDWELRSTLEEVQISYQYMLKYMMQGIADPSRSGLYNQLVSKLYTLADHARVLSMAQLSTELYFDRFRFYSHVRVKSISDFQLELESFTEESALKKLISGLNNEAELNELRKRHENALTELFCRVWVSGRWTEEDESAAYCLLNSVLISINDLSLFVSAVMLSLTENFDIRKLMFLFEAYQHSSKEVNQRALVGLVIIVTLYNHRLSLYPDIASRFKLLNESPAFSDNLLTIQIQFLRSRETEKIDKKMREEIIPEMVRNMNRMNKIELEDSEDEGGANDMNPDWESWAEKSGLQDKLKEMSELQMEGADVYMSTFSQLKRYPFFNDIANWFYPFDKQHSAVVQVLGGESVKQFSFLNGLLQSGFFCNSDKYSFCFTIMQVPEAQRTMMIQQLEEQNLSMSENGMRDKMNAFAQRSENISNQYIQDLYRFYKIYPRRHEFWSPFGPGVDICQSAVLNEIIYQPYFMRTQADFLFQKEHFFEASPIYKDLIDLNAGDAELYQKLGFCLQRSKLYKEAVKAYLNADLEKPDNLWTNHHLAICYRQMEQYEKALEYYRKVEAVQPENLKVVTQIGLCMAKLKQNEEALAYFFKVEYLNGGSPTIWRAIGWCSFMIGKPEQAMKYYEKLMGRKDAGAQDYLNAGHVAWVLGCIEKAMTMYISCRRMLTGDDDFMIVFNGDKAVLVSHGIQEEEIPLMRDLVFFNYRNS